MVSRSVACALEPAIGSSSVRYTGGEPLCLFIRAMTGFRLCVNTQEAGETVPVTTMTPEFRIMLRRSERSTNTRAGKMDLRNGGAGISLGFFRDPRYAPYARSSLRGKIPADRTCTISSVLPIFHGPILGCIWIGSPDGYGAGLGPHGSIPPRVRPLFDRVCPQ
jgi:hypothetical protein